MRLGTFLFDQVYHPHRLQRGLSLEKCEIKSREKQTPAPEGGGGAAGCPDAALPGGWILQSVGAGNLPAGGGEGEGEAWWGVGGGVRRPPKATT